MSISSVSVADDRPAFVDAPPLSIPPASLLEAAQSVRVDTTAPGTVLLFDHRLTFESDQRLVERMHQIYRVNSATTTGVLDRVAAAWDPTRQERPTIAARVVTADGRESPLDPATLGELPLTPDGPQLFSDVRLYGGPLPGIAAGSVVEVLITMRDRTPLFAAGTTRQIEVPDLLPVQHTRILVEAAAPLELRHAQVLLNDAVVRESRTAGWQRLEVERGPAPPHSIEPLEAAEDQHVRPALIVSTASSWTAVAAGYAAIAEPAIRREEVRSLLPATLPPSRPERLRIALERLHETVRYTGVLFGTAKIVPQSPAKVLARGYGDCKDKAVVLASLLRAADIPAQLALTTMGPGPDLHPELPGLGAFDHLIVHVPGNPDLWIDATAEWNGVGEVPYSIAGRAALIVADGSELVRIPAAQPADQAMLETRTIRLADFGPSDIDVRVQARGESAAVLRLALDAAAQQQSTEVESLTRNVYGAESIERMKMIADSRRVAERDGIVLDIAARRSTNANTTLTESGVDLHIGPLLARMPYGLRYPLDLDDEAGAAESAPGARTADWVFVPQIQELSVEIVPPKGFAASSVPPNRILEMGPATLREEYTVAPDGKVTAHLRFDSAKGRYTVEEGERFRVAFNTLAASPVSRVRFAYEARTRAMANDFRASRQLHAQMMAARPTSALPYLRAAVDLMEIGQIEEARELARRAVKLEPKSPVAHQVLGRTLSFDPWGRQYATGFDYAGAVRAYRASLALDAESMDTRRQFASLLDYDADAIRYSPGARLDEAAEQLQWLIAREPGRQDIRERLLWCLWFAERFDKVREAAERVTDEWLARSMVLAADVVLRGVEQALAAATLPQDDSSMREKRAMNAVSFLIRARRYDEARSLADAAIRTEAPGFAHLQVLLPAIRRLETLPAPRNSPVGVTERMMRAVATGGAALQEFEPFVAASSRRARGMVDLREQLRSMSDATIFKIMSVESATPSEAADFAHAAATYESEGSDAAGYRVRVSFFGKPWISVYVIREAGTYRLRALSYTGGLLAAEILDRAGSGKLDAARQWLDWLREEARPPDSLDPLDQPPLLRVWPAAPDADPVTAVRTAAFVLSTSLDKKSAVNLTYDEVQAARGMARTSDEQLALDLVLYEVAESDPSVRVEIAERIAEASPRSDRAFTMLVSAYAQAKRFTDLERIVSIRRSARPLDRRALWARAVLASATADLGGAREDFRPLAEAANATPKDLNEYAWQWVLAGAADSTALEAARRALAQSQGKSWSIAHTLACLYALEGRLLDAQRTLVQALDVAAPGVATDNGVWLVRGLIAEQSGDAAAAMRAYRRVKSDRLLRDETLAIASQRLGKLAQTEGRRAVAVE